VPSRLLQGKLILIGTSATGLFDIKATPLDSAMPGVEVHAQLIQTILSGNFLERPNYALGAELALAAVVSLIMMLVVPIMGARPSFALGSGIAVLVIGGSLYLYANEGLLLSASYPLIVSLLIYFLLVFHNYFSEESQRRYVRAAFGQYISKELVEQLAEGHQKLELGGEIRDLTMLFSDVRGFTTISELYKADPQGLTRLMNRFLTPISNEIIQRRGTIDKYMGDAVMSFWNAPLDDPQHHRHACESALGILKAIDHLNEERRKEAEVFSQPFMPIRLGVGLNSGHCVVGNLGSDIHFNYSVMGDPVNVASRLEGLTKLYGVPLIIGERTYQGVVGQAGGQEDFALIEIDFIKVKGKNEPERIYALLGGKEVASSEAFRSCKQDVMAMLAAFRSRRWDDVAKKAKACRTQMGDLPLEGLLSLYEQRARELAANPPPDDWDGVTEAKTK
jgi:adenylate cyclase